MTTIVKIKDSQVILEDGSIEEYKPFKRMGEKLTATKGYAVIKDGKVTKSKSGQFEIYPKKNIATQVAASYK